MRSNGDEMGKYYLLSGCTRLASHPSMKTKRRAVQRVLAQSSPIYWCLKIEISVDYSLRIDHQ